MSTSIEIQRICQNCGNEFTARTTVTRYCSHRCNCAALKAKIRTRKIENSNKETNATITRSIEELQIKTFLSIEETCKLVGISRRTIYRMLARGELIAGKAGKRTILKRSEIDQLLFEKPAVALTQPEKVNHDISDCYTLKEIKDKYGIAEATIRNLIKRNNIPKIRKGIFAYVPKTMIDKLLS